MKKIILATLVLGLGLTSCKKDAPETPEVDSSTQSSLTTQADAEQQKQAEDARKVQAEKLAELNKETPLEEAAVMTFTETTHDFGKLEQDAKATHIFKFKNTGNAPLVIREAKGSCGCTVPNYPKEPVAVGESGEIEVTFSSGKKTGNQSKNVTIYANTNPNPVILTIKAELPASTAVNAAPGQPSSSATPQQNMKIHTAPADQEVSGPGKDIRTNK